jgi:hypothetical protein
LEIIHPPAIVNPMVPHAVSQHGRCFSHSTPGREVLLPKKCHVHFRNCIHLQQIKYRLLIKLIKNKSRHNFISNLSSATCSGFVSHLYAEYIIVVRTIDYNAVSGFDEISSYIIMEYYKNID